MNTPDKFSNTIKRSILDNTVDELTELRHLKATTAQLQVTTGTVISYYGYFHYYIALHPIMINNSLLELTPKDENTQYINMKQLQMKMMKNMNHVDTNIEDLIITTPALMNSTKFLLAINISISTYS